MAKAVHLTGGTSGKKNTNARSAAAQKPHKSKPVATKKAAVRPYTGKAEGHGSEGMNAITRPSMPHAAGKVIGHAREWMNSHGLDPAATRAVVAAVSSAKQRVADKAGSTKTSNKSTKKSAVQTPTSSGPKVSYQKRAAKGSGPKPYILPSSK